MRSKLSSKVVVAVLALFLVLSVGYALFSQSVTVSGTATAKGNFKISTTCTTEVSSDMKTYMGGDAQTERGYNNPECVVSDNVVTYSADLNYPGAIKYFQIKFTNMGDITAEISGAALLSSMEGTNTLKTYNSTTNELISTEEISASGGFVGLNDAGVAFESSTGTFVSIDSVDASNYFVTDSVGNITKIILEPNESMFYIVRTEWPNSSTYSQSGVYYKATQSVSLPWSQYTE